MSQTKAQCKQCPPPSYADLGKQARDLFTKGYNVGFLKIDSTTKPHEQAEIKLGAAHNVGTGRMAGNVDLKYKFPKYGLTLTEKWHTDNVLTTELVCADQLSTGSKVTLLSDYSPMTKARSATVKGEFGNDMVHMNTDVSLIASPKINASMVFGYQNWLMGVSSGYDTEKSALTHTNISAGRAFGSYVLNININNQTTYGASVYHRPNEKLELAANLSWAQGDQSPLFGLASQYKVDNSWTVRSKLMQNSQISFGTTHNLNEHLKLTMSMLCDLKSFNEGGHKFGMGFEYDPCCSK